MTKGYGGDVIDAVYPLKSGAEPRTVVAGGEVFSPSFDVMPADLIDFMVTEREVGIALMTKNGTTHVSSVPALT
ncbi:hypothetical protein WG219_07765 [Ectopseudomonas mendocina]|uniref:Uncharacterized protein n=1 Tax=Ectopseudomonas mendocina TaxID=300 RepID=A0ABZ2RQD2_ECTME